MSNLKSQIWGNYQLYSLTNSHGTQVDISDLGAIIVNFFSKNSNGKLKNIVLGYDEPQRYLDSQCYFGCVVGPWANRIANGKYTIDSLAVELETNEGTNHLHGASANIGSKRWRVTVAEEHFIELTTSTLSGEAGYPHDIDFKVIYELTEENKLKIGYFATPHGKTPINMTQHTYFNLAESKDILDHSLQIESHHYLLVDSESIPLDNADVTNTPMDFRVKKRVSQDIDDNFSQLAQAGGFDHCWCFDSTEMKKVATLYSPNKDLGLEVYTDQIGMQFYSGNFIVKEQGRNNKIYEKHAGLCLETQNYPNKINMDGREDCIFESSSPYSHFVTYKVI
ncbi:aldose epimerase family protein [Psychromonas ossibalaenae]|uniref:aldose epimerase family protein n=1 Tax=Psychromonas ossibalaenae TaxID=444922 RepID=UPI000379AC9E|nr:aldose epimerase family protein [Psychromonas ossibalaenae]